MGDEAKGGRAGVGRVHLSKSMALWGEAGRTARGNHMSPKVNEMDSDVKTGTDTTQPPRA